jgi:hypothetical protein
MTGHIAAQQRCPQVDQLPKRASREMACSAGDREARRSPLTANAAPDPMTLHPVAGQPRVVLLRPLITSPLIEVGEFSYYDDPEFADEFETRNVLHHCGPDRLIIGKFCALAAGTTFIMNGANHRMSGLSTFPFPIMGGPWAAHIDLVTDLPSRGDTVMAATYGSVEKPRSCPECTSVMGRLSRQDRWSPKTCRTTPSSARTRNTHSRPLRSRRGPVPGASCMVGLADRCHHREHQNHRRRAREGRRTDRPDAASLNDGSPGKNARPSRQLRMFAA